MQRPVMNPSFVFDAPVPGKPRRKPFAWVMRPFKLIGRLLLANPFGARAHFRNEEGTRFSRFIRGLTYRLAFAPVLLAVFLTAIVLAATHPGRPQHGPDPLAFGVYYDPVNFLADDGARLDGWLVPVLDAKRVLEEKDSYNKRYPAVVLVHDFSATRQQLLPLVKPLHNAGFVVLSINLRGAGSLSGEAQTFGIREARDVKAAVDMLRRRAFVDPARIAVIGIGTGANACVIAARNDPAIAAIVLSDPVNGFDEAFASRVGADHAWLPPLRPLFRWTFQIMYGVDTAELDMHHFAPLIAQRHVLLTDGRQQLMEPAAIRGLQRFLQKHLAEQVAAAK